MNYPEVNHNERRALNTYDRIYRAIAAATREELRPVVAGALTVAAVLYDLIDALPHAGRGEE